VAVETLVPDATALGEAWANDCAKALRAQSRGVVGAWPGTLREARSRVLVGLPSVRRQPSLDTVALDVLSRAVYEAARRYWTAISEPDLEP
jgi:hypothetical protein